MAGVKKYMYQGGSDDPGGIERWENPGTSTRSQGRQGREDCGGGERPGGGGVGEDVAETRPGAEEDERDPESEDDEHQQTH